MANWKCPECGVEAASAGSRRCEACGHADFGRLVLIADGGQQLTFNIDLDVGQRLLAPIVGDDAKFVSSHQYRLARDPRLGAWVVQPNAEAANPTCLDGNPIDVATAVADGTVVSIGPGRARLRARIDY